MNFKFNLDEIKRIEKLEAERSKIISDYEAGEKTYISIILKEKFIKCTCDDCGITFYYSKRFGPRIYCKECYNYRLSVSNFKKLKAAEIAYKAIISNRNAAINHLIDKTIYTPLNI